jgi:hypothetical protein
MNGFKVVIRIQSFNICTLRIERGRIQSIGSPSQMEKKLQTKVLSVIASTISRNHRPPRIQKSDLMNYFLISIGHQGWKATGAHKSQIKMKFIMSYLRCIRVKAQALMASIKSSGGRWICQQ